MKELVRSMQRALRRAPSHSAGSLRRDPGTGVLCRHYHDYRSYVDHQASKLSSKTSGIFEYDKQYEDIVAARYEDVQNFHGARVICLGARLGGEVRAFKRLGALAVGIDIEPGPKNEHVLHGDFHEVQFPDSSFDVAFSNAFDHVLDPASFLSEVNRLLVPGGTFYLEVTKSPIREDSYEVLDTSRFDALLPLFAPYFRVEWRKVIENKASFVHWCGDWICFRCRTVERGPSRRCDVGSTRHAELVH